MSQKEPKRAQALRREDLPLLQQHREFFSGPEAAKLISDQTGYPCTVHELKDIILLGVVRCFIKFSERCLLPLARPVKDISEELVAAQREAHRNHPGQDQIITLNDKKYLLRGLKTPLELCPDDWVWPIEAGDTCILDRGELSDQLIKSITEPRPISGSDLAEEPSIQIPIPPGLGTTASLKLQGIGWGSEFFNDDFLDEIDQIAPDVRSGNRGSTSTREVGISRLITPKGLGSAKLEVVFDFGLIVSIAGQIARPRAMPKGLLNEAPESKRPMATKSLNLWQDFLRRFARAELGDKFDPNSKEETVRQLLGRIERLEEEGKIHAPEKFPSRRWIRNNLF